jgi:O-antigen ligase
MPIDGLQRLTPALIAVPLGVLAAAVAVLGAAINPLVPIAFGAGAVVFAIGYVRPLWLVYLAVASLPLEFELHEVAFFDLTPAKAFFVIGAAGWAASQLVNGRPLIADSPLTLPLIVVVITVLPGLLVAENTVVVFNKLVIWVACFFLFQAVIQAGDENFVRKLMVAFAVAGAGLGFLAMTDVSFQGQSASEGGTFVSNRARAGQNSPNGLAALLVTGILPALCMAFTGPLWRRAAFALAAAIGTYGLLLTQSRGGFLAFLAGLLALVTWRPARRIGLATLIVLAALAFGGINPLGNFLDETAIGERIASITTTATKTDPRIPVYRRTVEVIGDHPLFGVGTSDFQSAAVEYGIMTSATALTHAHNGPLTIAAERGLIGLAAFIYFAFVLGSVLTRGLAHATGEKRAMLTAVMAVFMACAAHLLVDYTLGSAVLLGELFVLAGCAVLLVRRMGEATAADRVETPAPAGRPPIRQPSAQPGV